MSPRAHAPGIGRPAPDRQPGLPIAVPAPGIPGRLLPEASTPCSAPFDGDDWLFSVDWAGSRCLLVAAADGTIRLQGENGPLDDRFPEIVVAAASFCAGRTAILDGTICILDGQGRPDLGALFRRAAAGRTAPSAVYLVTDLLHLDGESTAARPLLARLAALSELIPADSCIQAPDHVVGHGRALAGAAAGRGLAAILARRQDARYQAGMASPDRLRISLSGRRDAVVVGWRSTSSGVRIVLGDWAPGGRLSLVGTAAVDDPEARRWLHARAEPGPDLAIEDRETAGPGVTWTRPRLVATVEPDGATSRASLPEWRLVALRDDVDPVWCVRRTPVDPPRSSAHRQLRPFSPTVLTALPMDRTA